MALEKPGNTLHRTDWDTWYEMSGDLSNLLSSWSDVCTDNPPPRQVFSVLDTGNEAKWQQTKTAYNEWCEREHAAICAETERGAIQ